MKKQIFTAIFAAALMCVSVSSILAQPRGPKIIYVDDPVISSTVPQDDQKLNSRLAAAAVVFIEVRLNSLKDLNVKRTINGPCRSDGTQTTAQSVPAETSLPDSFEVRTAIRTLGVNAADPNQKELQLVLDFELVKYAKCKQTSLVHRSDPISEKTAFDAFLQMGDVLEVKLRSELTPPKINVDVSDISTENDALQSVKDDLTSRLFTRLTSETDFRVRDVRGAKPSEDADYIITGVLAKDKKGVRFTVRNVKDSSKTQSPFVSGPTDQKNTDALNVFYSKAADAVVSYIRVCPATPPTDEEVGNTIHQATELLCQNNSTCEPKPSEVILLLTRLTCAGKQTARSLKLLGDAYVLTEDFVKAADTYHRSWNMLSSDRQDEIVSTVSAEGDAWYRAENYGNAAQSYELAIAKSPEQQPAGEAIYLQRVRSYRFSSDPQHALAAALDGLTKYPTSDELGAELFLAVADPRNESAGYDLLLKNLDAVGKLPPSVQKDLAHRLLAEVYVKIFYPKNLDEIDRRLRLVEAIPLASLPPEDQDQYKILRAIWQKEAKNDLANAVTVLQPFSQQTSEIAEVAAYFLADAYYQRARQLNNKADYGNAVKLLKKVIEESDIFYYEALYAHLIVANHELGQDQQTRRYVESKLQFGTEPTSARALVLLCVNYLKDFECADKKNAEYQGYQEFTVAKLELHVLRGDYAEADKLFDSIVMNLNDTDYQNAVNEAVTMFYRVWTSYVLKREADAQAASRRWKKGLDSVRVISEPTYWVFDAANRALDAETKLSPDQKNRLREMIRIMDDKFRPVAIR